MKRTTKGFTIIELLVATSVFSVVLLVLTASILRIGRIYYKGVTSSKTQEATRLVINDISRSLQFEGGSFQIPAINGSSKGYCIGGRLYSYNLNSKVQNSPVRHALVVDTPVGGCAQAQNLTGASINGKELLGENMRLADISVARVVNHQDLYNIKVRIVYGDDDLICSPSVAGDCTSNRAGPPAANPDITCKSTAGGQFCATSELSTTVQKRI